MWLNDDEDTGDSAAEHNVWSATAVRALHHLTVACARLGRLNRALFGLVLPLRFGRLHHDAA